MTDKQLACYLRQIASRLIDAMDAADDLLVDVTERETSRNPLTGITSLGRPTAFEKLEELHEGLKTDIANLEQ